MLSEKKIEQLRTTVSLENIAGTISCEHGAQMLPLFYPLIWILIHCNCFVIHYFLLAQDEGKARNFKYQNLVFSFLAYVII